VDSRVVKSWIADEKDKRLSHTDERVDRYGVIHDLTPLLH